MAPLLCGVHLIVQTLLVLTVDRISSYVRCTDKCNSVIVINLDDQASLLVSFLVQIVRFIFGLLTNTLIMMFLFGSPQFLSTNPEFICTIFEWRETGLLQSVDLDGSSLPTRQVANVRAVFFSKWGLSFSSHSCQRQIILPLDHFTSNSQQPCQRKATGW